jgi:hypothetical protein
MKWTLKRLKPKDISSKKSKVQEVIGSKMGKAQKKCKINGLGPCR